MAQTLPEGAVISPADIKRIESAYDTLVKTNNASDSLTVTVLLHVHHEYPKHLGVDKDDKAVIVNSAAEETAYLALNQEPAPKLPSEADLDANADEEKARETTSAKAWGAKPKKG